MEDWYMEEILRPLLPPCKFGRVECVALGWAVGLWVEDSGICHPTLP